MAYDFPSSPTVGQQYNPSSGPTYVWNGTAWVVLTPGNQFNRTVFTATAGQTTFTMNYVVGAIDVYRNGVKLAPADFTATNGTSIVLLNAATVGDTIEVISYPMITYSDAVRRTGDTMTGALTVPMVVTDSPLGFRNKIINGDMRIDQRNNGASVVPNGSGLFPVDRWLVRNTTDGTATVQRSTVVPNSSYTNSIVYTVTGTDTNLITTQFADIQQRIEGLNMADFGWGTSAAQPITISFWVRSSVTGTYAVTPHNNAFNRAYPAQYTINATNTWEYKTLTIPGETTGTWLSDNGIGVFLSFTLCSGPTYIGTGNTWNTTGVLTTSSQTNFMATNGATFYLTGVQLEVGSVATPFERRPYGLEYELCRRYYRNFNIIGGFGAEPILVRGGAAGNRYYGAMAIDSRMRATPTLAIYSTGVHKPYIRYDSYSITNVQVNESYFGLEVVPSIDDGAANSPVVMFSNTNITLSAEL